MQASQSAAGLPRRDTWMMGILLGIMIATDVAAVATGIPDKARPALFLLPGALAMVWAAYAVTFRWGARRYDGNRFAANKLGRFMGGTLSLVGGLLTVEHVALLGSFAWFGPIPPLTFVRVFTAAIGIVMMVIFNRAPKVMAGLPEPGFPTFGAFFSGQAMRRETAWTGVACSVGIVALALFAPIGHIAGWIFLLGLTPMAVQIGLTLAHRRPD
jgi:hypothetical protein